jgi:hypothetical protein
VTYKKAGTAILILVLIAFPALTVHPQQSDYTEIFGNNWQKALDFVEENSSWIKPALKKYGIPYAEAVAVVFPELVRYSSLRDKMEVTLLKTLYRNLGDDYADFSVGVFQVKPSFAEKIIEQSKGSRTGRFFLAREKFPNDYLFRASVVSDLEDPKREFLYIIAFMKICNKKFITNSEDEASRIKFLATAYNTGFWKSEEEIRVMTEKKFFNTKLFKTENYSYADVSLFWYNQYLQMIKNIK